MDSNKILILALAIFVFYLFRKQQKIEKEGMTNTASVAQADLDAIKTLAEVAMKLQTGGLTNPGALNVTGTLTSNSLTFRGFDIREYFTPGYFQGSHEVRNRNNTGNDLVASNLILSRGFMLGILSNHAQARDPYANLAIKFPNIPRTYVGNFFGVPFHILKVNPGFKVKIWTIPEYVNMLTGSGRPNDQNAITITSNKAAFILTGPTTFIATKCFNNDCNRFVSNSTTIEGAKFMPDNTVPIPFAASLVWCGYDNETPPVLENNDVFPLFYN
jgi:hypothetical protein